MPRQSDSVTLCGRIPHLPLGALAATVFVSLLGSAPAPAEDAPAIGGNAQLARYFAAETRALASSDRANTLTAAEWTAQKAELKTQLREMLGLDPWPEQTPLEPVITGRVEHEQFLVEKLHFQSRPGLYVTGNLYLPKAQTAPAPAILYVCGHAKVVKDGVPLGNKTGYQHHGAWFARHGYVCLVIDTIQLGEISGFHHGTYNLNQWWWNARGYTPAGVEAWNGIRALDYLETRPEVDKTRFGVTGRSGGGAYSWWIAALDERIKAAVPVAGITDLENHVVDGTVEGHCDCMFPLNTYRWDFGTVAALIAPRPLLISNTDKDGIFPLDGVVRVHERARRIYRLLGAGDKLGLQITEGGHVDTQELHIHAFRWFNRFLKDDTTSQITVAAVPLFPPEALKVFETLPADERVTTTAEWFVPHAKMPAAPSSPEAWAASRDTWLRVLREKSFRGWPALDGEAEPALDLRPVFDETSGGVRFSAVDFTSQHNVSLRLFVAHRAGLAPADLELVVLNVLDDAGWRKFVATYRGPFAEQFSNIVDLPAEESDEFESTKKMFAAFKWGMAYVAPRGIGPDAWTGSEQHLTHIRRRFQLLGQTVDGMRTYDIVRAARALREQDGLRKVPLWIQGEDTSAGLALYASLFIPEVTRLDLHRLPASHQSGPDFLNVLRYLDLPVAVAMAGERSKVILYQRADSALPEETWSFPRSVLSVLGQDAKRLQVRTFPAER